MCSFNMHESFFPTPHGEPPWLLWIQILLQDMLEQEELTVKERQSQITELSATQVGQHPQIVMIGYKKIEENGWCCWWVLFRLLFGFCLFFCWRVRFVFLPLIEKDYHILLNEKGELRQPWNVHLMDPAWLSESFASTKRRLGWFRNFGPLTNYVRPATRTMLTFWLSLRLKVESMM